MSSEEQFYAAVNVIKNLPTDGKKDAPFQPSDDLKLKFYSYFKQATEGKLDPKKHPKPSFYDIVGKYKWNAWKDLGDMSKEDAMKGYVRELKSIIETMSLTEPVADFYEALGPFYEFVDIGKKRPNGQLNGNAIMAGESISSSPTKKPLCNGDVPNGDALGLTYGNGTKAKGSVHDGESDTEEFSDTYDHIAEDNNLIQSAKLDDIISARGESELSPPRFNPGNVSSRPSSSRQSGYRAQNICAASSFAQSSGGAGGGQQSAGREQLSEVNEQIAVAVLRLQQSMEQVVCLIDTLETHLRGRNSGSTSKKGGWWPFPELSPTTTAFLVLWPFVAHLLINTIRERRRP